VNLDAFALDASEHLDAHWLDENRDLGQSQCGKRIPAHYADATPDHPDIAQWVRDIVAAAAEQARARNHVVRTGPSLLILGPVGTGKTHQAYGAIRALAHSGVTCSWRVETAADIYAQLRPRPRFDSEQEFRDLASVRLLAIDDLGAAKGSEWTEEVNYRLINHRYEQELPTIITSNLMAKDLSANLGERVTSRLVEMARRVNLVGDDRRRPKKDAA
jgi:DNA replication protein DnaC